MTIKYQQRLFYFLFIIVYLSVSLPNGGTYLGIDASWHQALVMAFDNGFVFGKDFIFNYGPFGFINTGLLPKTVSIWFSVVLQAFTLSNYLFLIHLVFKETPENWNWAAFISLIVFLPWGFISDASFTSFYFQLMWLFYAWRTRRFESLFILIILTVLLFYIKVNLSIISYTVFYGSLLYFGFKQLFSWRVIIGVIILQIGLTVALSLLLKVDLMGYLASSLQIIDAYQDAMSTFILSKREFAVLFFFELAMLAVALFYIAKHRYSFLNNLYLYLLISLTWFLNFKQAHTAIGHYNIFGYFLLMPPLAILLYVFCEQQLKKDFGRLFVVILIVQLISTQIIRFYIGNYSLKGYLKTYPPTDVVKAIENGELGLKQIISAKNPLRFFMAINNYDYENNFKNNDFLKQRKLASSIVNKIGKSSVDIMPYEISYLYFNKLNYNPRPIIQSYQANNDWLARKNAEKYNADSAPSFVLSRLDYFREQNPIWMDGKAYLQLIHNYNLIDTSTTTADTLFLFKKFRKNNLTSTVIGKFNAKLNEEIAIPSSSHLLYLSATIEYSFLGKLSRLLFQPPYLYVTVTYDSGQQETFRMPTPIAKSGILINKKVTTQAELARLSIEKGKGLINIKKIRFWGAIQRGFKPDFTYQIDSISL